MESRHEKIYEEACDPFIRYIRGQFTTSQDIPYGGLSD